jgi:hypothetical protein
MARGGTCDDVEGQIPLSTTADAGPWQGVSDLRESLFRQGRLWEESKLLRAKRGFRNLKHRQATIRAYLDSYRRLESELSDNPEFLRVQGEAKLAMAETLKISGEPQRAEAELAEADLLFDKYLELMDD